MEARRAASSRRQSLEQSQMAARKVLVVDGDWKIRRLIRTNLEARGLEVVEAISAGAGQALAGGGCDLILLSAQLPDANGWNVVGGWRRQGVGAEVPIIVIVAEPVNPRLLRRFQKVSQLLKPFSAGTLLACVDRALGARRER